MKKGDMVLVSDRARYNGQDMKWTEECTGMKLFKKGTKFYHWSDTLLSLFLNKETCFFDTRDSGKNYCYEYTLKEERKLPTFCDEVRINLGKKDEIRFLGKVILEYDYNVVVVDPVYGGGPKITRKDKRIA